MKTIEQLLQLATNPHYTFNPEEKERIDSFLEEKQEKASKRSAKKSSKKSSSKTPVTVKNIVQKTNTYAPEVDNSVS